MPRTMLGRVVGFSRALHSAGVEVNAGNLIDLCDSFQYISLHNRSDFYAAARATLVSRYDDLETFDEVFRAFWARPILPDDMTLTDTDAGGDPDLDVQADVNEVVDTADLQEEAEGEGESEEVGYSPDEALMGKDLAAMSDREIEQARKVIHEIVNIIANRRSRRRVPENRGLSWISGAHGGAMRCMVLMVWN